MFTVVQIVIALVLAIIAYWWISWKRNERKLAWIPKFPGHPIFGNVLDFKSPTDILKVLFRSVKQCNGLCSIDLLVKKLIVITDVKLLEILLTSTKILDKSSEYRFLEKWLGDGLLTARAARWRKSRKIITPAFHFSILGEFISVHEANANILIKQLEKELGEQSMDIYSYVTLCSLDIICETSMGVKINAQIDGKSDYVRAVKEMCRIVSDRGFSAIKQTDVLYPLTKDFYKELKCVKKLRSYTNSVISSRKKKLQNISAENEEKANVYEEDSNIKKNTAFLDLLLQSTVDGEPLPDWYIEEEVNTLMFEGHDTTATAISFALYCLATHPEVQARAVEEQQAIFGKDRDRAVTFSDIQEMKYLQLVIKETIRMYPSVPFIGRNTDVDIVYKEGKIIPKGTTLMMFIYGLHYDPNIFPDPEKFDPTRFERMGGTSPFVYLPFSAGPRNCIGQKFAMQEMKIVISKVLRNYELLPTTPKHTLILASETVLKSVNGIKIKLKRRNWD